MSELICTCPQCERPYGEDPDSVWSVCPKCGHRFKVWQDDDHYPQAGSDHDIDYGGVFDGFTVTSDADPGL